MGKLAAVIVIVLSLSFLYVSGTYELYKPLENTITLKIDSSRDWSSAKIVDPPLLVSKDPDPTLFTVVTNGYTSDDYYQMTKSRDGVWMKAKVRYAYDITDQHALELFQKHGPWWDLPEVTEKHRSSVDRIITTHTSSELQSNEFIDNNFLKKYMINDGEGLVSVIDPETIEIDTQVSEARLQAEKYYGQDL